MTEKFWMSRESVLEPIEKFLQELEDRRDEIEKITDEYEAVSIEIRDKFRKMSPYQLMRICTGYSRNYEDCLDTTTLRCVRLRTSVNVADDGRILCDHDTDRFLRMLPLAIDLEIRSISHEIENMMQEIKLEPAPRYVAKWDCEPSNEPHSGAVVFLIVAIATLCVGFMYAIKAGAF